MKLRVYAVVVSLAFLAALTKPTRQDHYAKLEEAYPWARESLLEDAIEAIVERSAGNGPYAKLEIPEPRAEPLPPALRYTDLGVVSMVYAEERWLPCDEPTGELRSPVSVGLFRHVFVGSNAERLAQKDAKEPAG